MANSTTIANVTIGATTIVILACDWLFTDDIMDWSVEDRDRGLNYHVNTSDTKGNFSCGVGVTLQEALAEFNLEVTRAYLALEAQANQTVESLDSYNLNAFIAKHDFDERTRENPVVNILETASV